MDWVRGRPPDALLFLKAMLKAAPSGLSVAPPTARDGTAGLTASKPSLAVGGVSRGSIVAYPAPTMANGAGVPDGMGVTHRRSSGSGASGGRGEEGPRDVTFSSPSVAVGGEVGVVPTPRTLAEGALLAPLRDVGTVAGALRRGVGTGLREMAAAR